MSDNATTRPALGKDDIRAEIMLAWLAAREIVALSAEEMLEAYSRAHAAGPMLDPTLYRDKLEAARQDETVIRILAEAKRKLLAAFPMSEAGSGFQGIATRGEARTAALSLRDALALAADARRKIEDAGLQAPAGLDETGYGHGV